jgi:hypothetical protein
VLLAMSCSWIQALLTGLAVLVPVYWILGHLVERWAYRHYTVLDDMKRLGTPRDGKLASKAVICGGRFVFLLLWSVNLKKLNLLLPSASQYSRPPRSSGVLRPF